MSDQDMIATAALCGVLMTTLGAVFETAMTYHIAAQPCRAPRL